MRSGIGCDRRQSLEVYAQNLAPAHLFDDDAKASDDEHLTSARHATEPFHDQAANCANFFTADIHAKRFRQRVERNATSDPELAIVPTLELTLVLAVVFVVDLTNHFFEDVFDGYYACRTTVFIHHNRDVARQTSGVERQIRKFVER